MADDLKNVRLSKHATEIADRIFDSGFFEDRISVSKFALAYAVRNHYSEIDPELLDSKYDSDGSNYNIGSIDDDKFLSNLIVSLYPSTTSPYRYVRALMIFGLEKLGELLDKGQLYPLNSLMIDTVKADKT